MKDVVSETHLDCASKVRSILATYKRAEDLVNIGAYVEGSNPRIDHALKYIDKVNAFLQQGIYEAVTFDEAVAELQRIFEEDR
jgi:flagellum-specific ATP synthase